jgi:DNA (cytosine-5)-methyltransferase 3A
MKVLSLFDGISCARVALERAGIPVEAYYASEIDKYAIQVSEKNYPGIQHIGSVTELYPTPNLHNLDLLIGGSPCQDLSIAKKDRKGLDGERSGLFWEYVRILKEVKPKYFILENVASMPKEAKEVITREMGVEPIMINAALVSAQNRKRLFWTNIPNVVQPEDRGILLKDILEGDNENVRACSLRGRYTIEGRRKDIKGAKTQQRLELGGDKANAITSVTKDSLVFIGGIGKKDWVGDGKYFSRNYPQGQRVYSPEGKTPTLSANGGGLGAKTGLYEIDGDIRKLTPIECERLQGLPDNYTAGVSNTQRYKCCGNAFNVDVVAHILSFIK